MEELFQGAVSASQSADRGSCAVDRPCFMMIARSESGEEAGGEGGILPEHPRKFSVVMVKLKSFAVNERFVEKPFCQCHWKILGLGFRRKS